MTMFLPGGGTIIKENLIFDTFYSLWKNSSSLSQRDSKQNAVNIHVKGTMLRCDNTCQICIHMRSPVWTTQKDRIKANIATPQGPLRVLGGELTRTAFESGGWSSHGLAAIRDCCNLTNAGPQACYKSHSIDRKYTFVYRAA